MREKTYRTRILSCLLAGVMLLSLSGCGKSDDTPNLSTAGQTESSSQSTGDADNRRILIAYFTAAENSGVDAITSASYTMIDGEAVGRVRAVADMIQAQTGGDLFSIQTSTVYPADGGALIEQAAEEQNDDFRPELTSHIENLEDYDVIFVGYAGGIIGLN